MTTETERAGLVEICLNEIYEADPLAYAMIPENFFSIAYPGENSMNLFEEPMLDKATQQSLLRLEVIEPKFYDGYLYFKLRIVFVSFAKGEEVYLVPFSKRPDREGTLGSYKTTELSCVKGDGMLNDTVFDAIVEEAHEWMECYSLHGNYNAMYSQGCSRISLIPPRGNRVGNQTIQLCGRLVVNRNPNNQDVKPGFELTSYDLLKYLRCGKKGESYGPQPGHVAAQRIERSATASSISRRAVEAPASPVPSFQAVAEKAPAAKKGRKPAAGKQAVPEAPKDDIPF